MCLKASILVNTFNHEKYIKKCIDSCLEQDFPRENFEIIIVDDGSNDSTKDILTQYSENIKVIGNKNSGQGESINLAINASRGKFLFFLDGDDYIRNDRLQKIVSEFEKNKNVGIIVNNRIIKYENKRDEYKSLYLDKNFDFKSVFLDPGPDSFLKATKYPYNTSAISIRKSAILDFFRPPKEALICTDMYLMSICLNNSYLFLNQSLTFYRHHNYNLFLNGPKSRKILFKSKKFIWDKIIEDSKELKLETRKLHLEKKLDLKDLFIEHLFNNKKITLKDYFRNKSKTFSLSKKTKISLIILGDRNTLALKECYLKLKFHILRFKKNKEK